MSRALLPAALLPVAVAAHVCAWVWLVSRVWGSTW